jgi:hypothetical protein
VFYGCNQTTTEQKKKIDVSEVAIEVNLLRFEKDLMTTDSINAENLHQLKAKYGTFFTLFCRKICPIPMDMKNETELIKQLNFFKFDKDIQTISAKTDSVYPNLDWLKVELNEMLKHRKHYYPDSLVPEVITFISAFNYAVVTTDSLLLIGLDKYLGSNCEFYPAMNYPMFMTKRLRKEYITANCIQALYQKDYDVDLLKNEMLAQMIYYGKMVYYTDMMAPEMSDTIKLGYTDKQLNWCYENEDKIWTLLIEQKLLYSTNTRTFLKLINDGPTTQGFPKESPARLGYFVGWQIVKAYMEKHPEITLAQLCAETDAQKILAESSYKPRK